MPAKRVLPGVPWSGCATRAAVLTAAAVLSASFSLAVAQHGVGPSHPSPRLNAYFAADFKDPVYENGAFQKVLKRWHPPTPYPTAGKKTVVISRIDQDGGLSNTRFNLLSGSKSWDDAAMAAVRMAAPFPQLPGSYKRPSVEVHWHFEMAK